jgi:hypothetical protein
MSTDSGRTSRYRLVLGGELGDRFETLFEGMSLTRDGGNTVLIGTVKDQAHLAGLIERAQELGLDLISVGSVTEPSGRQSQREME